MYCSFCSCLLTAGQRGPPVCLLSVSLSLSISLSLSLLQHSQGSLPLSLSLLHSMWGKGASPHNPTPGHEGWSKLPGIMPTRCAIGHRGVKVECRSSIG